VRRTHQDQRLPCAYVSAEGPTKQQRGQQRYASDWFHVLCTLCRHRRDGDASLCSIGDRRAHRQAVRQSQRVGRRPKSPAGHLHTAKRHTEQHRMSMVGAWRELAQMRSPSLTVRGRGSSSGCRGCSGREEWQCAAILAQIHCHTLWLHAVLHIRPIGPLQRAHEQRKRGESAAVGETRLHR
jgi:hypothetical protein